MKRFLYLLSFIVIACTNHSEQGYKDSIKLKNGKWQLEFKLPDQNIARTNFNLTKNKIGYEIEFLNASESIIATEIEVKNDSIKIHDPLFSYYFIGKINNPKEIEGKWCKGNNYSIPFVATYGDATKFTPPKNSTTPKANISGKWEVNFSEDNASDHYKAIGQFEQVGNRLTGTFITETGDYRYLEGNLYNNNFYLSCFDGSHVFLFKGKVENEKLFGTFWSGTHWEEPWTGVRNESFELTHPDSLTYLKEGYKKLAFSFPNTNGDTISLTDNKYKNKVVIVNIMGPWCSNCKDETAYLSDLYAKNKEKGLEIIALSFDKNNNFNIARDNILRIRKFFNVDYDFLIAGKAEKEAAAESLPMLNHIMSYPTSIFIDRNGIIRKIRTGFYGPATGSYYSHYTEKMDQFVHKLLSEKENI